MRYLIIKDDLVVYQVDALNKEEMDLAEDGLYNVIDTKNGTFYSPQDRKFVKIISREEAETVSEEMALEILEEGYETVPEAKPNRKPSGFH